MKMTLSSTTTTATNASASEKSSSNLSDNKSISPNSSPRSSPRPSPRPETKRDHTKNDSYLSANFGKDSNNSSNSSRNDGSPNSFQDNSISNRNSSTNLNAESTKNDGTIVSSKSKTKKNSSWFPSLYSTYKSRSEELRKIFEDVPDDERLIVDYACALQREILAQGRLYVTQNYLCFYAYIFGWETKVSCKWKDVLAITKEKTALVIPNAVLITTRDEKHFFTSFFAREKTYLMLFRVWQNALMNQPMSAQEMWQSVHQSYGDELDLTSDDDYIAPRVEDDKLSGRLSIESFSEQEGKSPVDIPTDTMNIEPKSEEEIPVTLKPKRTASDSRLLTDMSDTTESDVDKPINKIVPPSPFPEKFPPDITPSTPESDDNDLVFTNSKCDNSPVECTHLHNGRQLLNEVYPIHIDQLFTLLFTSSKFYLDFHAARKTTDLTQTPWTLNQSNNSKSRIVNQTVALNQTMGPKFSQVTETQIMLPCSKAGQLYAIDIETVNAGVPYADSFSVTLHYCINKVSETETSIIVYAQINYKKSLWGLVKGMIEKNVWSGMEEFFLSLNKALSVEGEKCAPDVKRKSRRKKRIHSMPRQGVEDPLSFIGASNRIRMVPNGVFNSDVSTMIVFTVLILLVILNVMLYYKLWSLEDSPPYSVIDLQILKDPPKSHDEWIKVLQQQETLHTVEIHKWQRILKTAIHLLKQTEESLYELQKSLNPNYSSKIMTVLQNREDSSETDQVEL